MKCYSFFIPGDIKICLSHLKMVEEALKQYIIDKEYDNLEEVLDDATIMPMIRSNATNAEKAEYFRKLHESANGKNFIYSAMFKIYSQLRENPETIRKKPNKCQKQVFELIACDSKANIALDFGDCLSALITEIIPDKKSVLTLARSKLYIMVVENRYDEIEKNILHVLDEDARSLIINVIRSKKHPIIKSRTFKKYLDDSVGNPQFDTIFENIYWKYGEVVSQPGELE